MFLRSLAALALLAATGTAAAGEFFAMDPNADATPSKAKWVLNGALVSGNTKLRRIAHAENGIEFDAVRPGGLYQIAAGALFPLNDDIALQATIGFAHDSIHSNLNEDKAMFHKEFVEVLPYWGVDRHRFGLGVTYYWGAKYKENGDEKSGHSDFSTSFNDLAAPTIAYDWFYNNDFALGLRATKATFENDDPTIGELKADHYGIQLSWFL